MSLIIALHLGEGIVMASDSRTTYNNSSTSPNGTVTHNYGIHFSDSSYKTFLTPTGVGISTCGQASINNKPIAGYIESFINEYRTCNIDEIKDAIIPYFKALCPTIDTNFIIGGYINSDTTYEQKLYRVITKGDIITPIDTSIQGAIWDGEIDVLSRLITTVYNKQGKPITNHPIPFNHFTIQDAIDFAKFAIQTTIDTMKFQQRGKTVGGPIDILIIKPDNSFWIAKKELHK